MGEGLNAPHGDGGERSAGLGWGHAVSPLVGDPQPPGDQWYGSLRGYAAVLVLAVVVFTVYRFCNVDGQLFVGTSAKTVLDDLDGAVPGLFVCLTFLLARPLVASGVHGRPPLAGGHALTRLAIALLPTYYVAVVVTWLPRQSRLPGDWADLLEHLTFTQVFDGKRIFYTLGPAWAVSVGVICALLITGLVLGLNAYCLRADCDRGKRVTLLSGTAAAMALGSIAWQAASFQLWNRPLDGAFTSWYGPLANLDLVAVGLGLAIVVALRSDRPPLPVSSLAALRVAGVGVLVLVAVTRQHHEWVALYAAVANALGFGLLFSAETLGSERGDLWTRALGGRPLDRLAALSLGLYLWHEPVMLALRRLGLVEQTPVAFRQNLLLVLAVTLAVSWSTYIALQRPAQQLAALSAARRSSELRAPRRHPSADW